MMMMMMLRVGTSSVTRNCLGTLVDAVAAAAPLGVAVLVVATGIETAGVDAVAAAVAAGAGPYTGAATVGVGW